MLPPPQPEEPGEEGVQDEGQEVEERGRVEVLLCVSERWTHTHHTGAAAGVRPGLSTDARDVEGRTHGRWRLTHLVPRGPMAGEMSIHRKRKPAAQAHTVAYLHGQETGLCMQARTLPPFK